MPTILHHLRKDFREWRWLIAGWAVVLLVQGFAGLAEGSSGFMEILKTFPIYTFLIPLFAIPAIVQSDAVAGSRSFWMTRPLRATELLVAKSIVIAAAFIALPLAINIAIYLAFGLGADAFLAIPEFSLDRLFIVGLGFAIGTCTPTLARACLYYAAAFGIFLAATAIAEMNSARFSHDQNEEIFLSLAVSAGACVTVLLKYSLRHSHAAIFFAAGFLFFAPFLGGLLPTIPDPSDFVQRDATASELGLPDLRLVSEDGRLYRNYNQEPDRRYQNEGGPYVGLGARCEVKGLPAAHSIGIVASNLQITFAGTGRSITAGDSPRGLQTSRLLQGAPVGVPAAIADAAGGTDGSPLRWPDRKDYHPTLLGLTSLPVLGPWEKAAATVKGEATVDVFRHRLIATAPLEPGHVWRDEFSRYRVGRVGEISFAIHRRWPNLRFFAPTRRLRSQDYVPKTLAEADLHAVLRRPSASGEMENVRILLSDLMPHFNIVGQGLFTNATTGFFDDDHRYDFTDLDEGNEIAVVLREYVGTLTIPIDLGTIQPADVVDSTLSR